MTYSPEKREQVLDLYRENHSSLKTAAISGVSHATVSRIVNDAGEKYQRPPLTRKSMKENENHPSHGKLSGYDAGCRCELCRNRRKIHDKKQQVKRVLEGRNPY